MRRFLAPVKQLTGLDTAIALSVLARVWSAIAGAINIVLIGRFLTSAEQGYYYTFYSLVAFKIVFELGFSFVILQLASHEKALLTFHRDGCITGDARAHSRLASIFQKVLRWYGLASWLMAGTLVTFGTQFFLRNRQPGAPIAWQIPWLALVIASALAFQIDPVFSFLEGCGNVKGVALARLVQAMMASLFSWLAILLRHGLYSPALTILGQVAAGSWFLARNRRVLRSLWIHATGADAVRWRQEIWPFQWRVAASWASSYFILQFLNPVLFAYQGAVVAGRMGMSLSIVNAVAAVALAWITTKAAPFGNLVANRRLADLDNLFQRTLMQSSAVLAGSGLLLLASIWVVLKVHPNLGNRIITLPLFSLLLLTSFCGNVVFAEAYYLRAHKREPFMRIWILLALLSAAVTLWTAKHSGVAGVTTGFFLCGGLLRLLAGTYLFTKKRKEWHGA